MIIQNKSQAIDWTDYWTSEHARHAQACGYLTGIAEPEA